MEQLSLYSLFSPSIFPSQVLEKEWKPRLEVFQINSKGNVSPCDLSMGACNHGEEGHFATEEETRQVIPIQAEIFFTSKALGCGEELEMFNLDTPGEAFASEDFSAYPEAKPSFYSKANLSNG